MTAVNFAILTVSDRCSTGEAEDHSGPALRRILSSQSANFIILEEDCVPDEVNLIEEKLREWCKHGSCINVVLTTGGTGFAPRDVTPEATLKVVDRLCPAITAAMAVASLNVTPMAMLSRSVSGIKNSTLIVNLPGSVKGSSECLQTVLPCLTHASDLLRDIKTSIERTHSIMSQSRELPRSKVSEFKIAERQRISPWPMVSMEDATTIVMNSVPVLESFSVPLSEALGFVTSRDVLSTDNLPPFRASVKDGYAVVTSDGTGDFKVVSALTAGCSPVGLLHLGAKECVRVNTGGPIPQGADAVVQVEDTELIEFDEAGNEILVRILVQPKLDQDIRPIGCDITEGELVLPKGTEIRSSEAGILAAVGTTTIPVHRLPVVAVLSTGNELVPAGEKLVPGAVRDSNMTTLRLLFAENGFKARDMGIAKDEPDTLLKELRRCLAVADVIVTTGSVSMGERDYLKDVLQHDLSAEIKFGRVNMKPGKPTTFAVLPFNGKTKFVFALPGNPASAAVMTHLLVLPALKKMSGRQSHLPTQVSVMMDFEVKLDPDRPEYRRAILAFDKTGCLIAKSTVKPLERGHAWNQEICSPSRGEMDSSRRRSAFITDGKLAENMFRIIGSQISSRLLSWRAANGLLILPSKKEVPSGILTKGSKVQALILTKI